MDQLEHLDKRRHIMKFSDVAPAKELIEELLWKAWKVTPSKNNFMPYQVNVLGPDKQAEKISVWNKSKKNKKRTNEEQIPGSEFNEFEEWDDKDGTNIYFDHLTSAPYLLVITQRVEMGNQMYQKNVREGDYYEQMHAEALPSIARGTSVEVGMFAANLTSFAIEAGIDASTILCFPADIEEWGDLPWVEHPVLLLMSLGNCEESRREFMARTEQEMHELDLKPEPESVINWV